jgi:signal transduction histidine kinase
VVFRVTDDGPGITPDEQPHLFQSFWQKNSVDRRGAGLGLSIVKEVVDAHGGRLWVESEPGVGSSFYFTLPVEELARERSPTAPTPLQTGKPAP